MEMATPERDDFAVSRMIAGLGAKVTMPVGTMALLQMLQQKKPSFLGL